MGSKTVYLIVIVLIVIIVAYRMGQYQVKTITKLKERFHDRTFDTLRIGLYYIFDWLARSVFPGGEGAIVALIGKT